MCLKIGFPVKNGRPAIYERTLVIFGGRSFWMGRIAALFKYHQAKLNNNPPAGDLEGGFEGNLKVDPYLGRSRNTILFLLVMFPPFTKIPVFQGKP